MFRLLLVCSCLLTIILSDEPCPTLDDFLNRSPYLAQFDPRLYEGIWYELAFYDYTQFSKACACTQLHWKVSTTDRSVYHDDFITTCPYEPVWLQKNYTVHMNGSVNNEQYPFFIPETGFDVQFNNTVVYYRQNVTDYDRAIQYQCKTDQRGKRLFTGVNFLSRTTLQSDAERKAVVDEMISVAVQAGVEREYLQQLKLVQWEHCPK